MAIHRIELSDGGRALGAIDLEDTREKVSGLLHTLAGRVATPEKVNFAISGANLFEVWELDGNRAMIIKGYRGNPRPELLQMK